MRIRCPYCGDRDLSEYTTLGSALPPRPSSDAPDALEKYFEAVYLRDNPAGLNQELWYHAHGCRSWLRVMRDTRTHEIHSVEFASATHP
jgi:heterotetrameric sarcosine oxidase delta subunit